jgi:glycosyltransferase involved in cell wall biosynthesis
VSYAATDLAIVVPTKDRPAKIREFLDSLCRQSARCGRILFIDGGASVRDVVLAYADRLPVEHHICQPPGQIRQRNMAIALLDERTPLVATMDDDIVFEADAIEKMIAFWNTVEAETAAVSFNIINTPPEPDTWLRRLFGLAGERPGKVLHSGMTTSNCQARQDYRADWVCGGAAVWRLQVLRDHPHRELPSRWAISEDVIFSYPIGRTYPLYVCAGARVRHEHVFDYGASRPYRFHGLTQTLWNFHFVESNRELSRAAYLWMVIGSALGRVVVGVSKFERRHLQFAYGQLEGVAKVLLARARGKDVASVIDEEARVSAR